MIIRMTEHEWINFDRVEKVVALGGAFPEKLSVLKIDYDGYENRGLSFDVKDQNEAIKIATEISYRMMLNGNLTWEKVVRINKEPLIKDGELGESYKDV